MKRINVFLALLASITMLVAAQSATAAQPTNDSSRVAAQNRPGQWMAQTALCYSYQSTTFRGRIAVQPPLMWTPFSTTWWVDSGGTIHTPAEQHVAYRVVLQMVVNRSWQTAAEGRWYYGRITGGGFMETPFTDSSVFDIFRRGTFRAVYQLYWYSTPFWPYTGTASGLAAFQSGYAAYDATSCTM
jgi:hypothetical protein